MTHAREEARRNAGVFKRLWWLAKGCWWRLNVSLRPSCERRSEPRITAAESANALRASLAQMVHALQQEEKKNEVR